MESQLMNLSVVEESSSTLVQQHEKNVDDDDDKIRDWLDLPGELLELIFSGLYDSDHISFSSIRDQIRFRLTCKRWQSSVDCLLGQFPFLMSQNPRNGGAFTFFNPITYKEIQVFDNDYDMKFPELVGHIHCSRFGGWLLMSRACLLFFYNPFIPGSTIKLPYSRIPFIQYTDSMSFTAPPTSKDCIVYVHHLYNPAGNNNNKVVIHRWCYGEDHWTSYHTRCQSFFGQSSGNPIFYRSVFYQLNERGRLGISDPRKGNEQHIWKDLPRPKPPYTSKRKWKQQQPKAQEHIWKDLPRPKPPYTRKRKWKQQQQQQQQPKAQEDDIIQEEKIHTKHYMAECDGKLVMVRVDYKDLYLVQSVHVFELDWSWMEWVTVKSLGNKAMFICETGSLLIKTNGGGAENKIYFPVFVNTKDGDDDHATKKIGGFYCLENRKYNFPPEDWKRVTRCTWIDTKFQL